MVKLWIQINVAENSIKIFRKPKISGSMSRLMASSLGPGGVSKLETFQKCVQVIFMLAKYSGTQLETTSPLYKKRLE